jgi:hypothetical protein
MLSTVIPKFIELVRKDSDRHISMTVLEELKEILEKVKGPALEGENHLQMIAACLKEVLLQKVRVDFNQFPISHPGLPGVLRRFETALLYPRPNPRDIMSGWLLSSRALPLAKYH